MKIKNAQWSKQKVAGSIILFIVYFVMLALIGFLLLTYDKLTNLSSVFPEKGPEYLYALCALFLLTVITYVYLFFEDREVLASAKKISVLFIVLALQIFVSFAMGKAGMSDGLVYISW